MSASPAAFSIMTIPGSLRFRLNHRYDPQRENCHHGFTLVELLISAAILAVAASMAGVLVTVSNRSIVASGQLSNASSAIESNIASIRALSESYTCCAGTCTTSPTASTSCIGVQGDSSYYFPQVAANVTAFGTLCTNGNLTNALMTAIDGLGQPANVTRAAAVKEDAVAHRLRITFSDANGISKVVEIVPTVAAWCP